MPLEEEDKELGFPCILADKISPIHAIFDLSNLLVDGRDFAFQDENHRFIQPVPVAFVTNLEKTKMLVWSSSGVGIENVSNESQNASIFVAKIEEQDVHEDESLVTISAEALHRCFKETFNMQLSCDEDQAFGIYTPFDNVSSSYFAVCFPISLPDEAFDCLASQLGAYRKSVFFETINKSLARIWADLAFSKICGVRAARISQMPYLSDAQVRKIWDYVKEEYRNNLQKQGVRLTLHELASTQDSLWLVCLTYLEGQFIAKDAVGEFALYHNPSLSKDQQPRHLKGRNGFYLTVRDEVINGERTPSGYHMLVSLKKPHPDFLRDRDKRSVTLSKEEFEAIKKKYHYECATCHIKEGKIDPRLGGVVKLQQGHRDPAKALSKDNCIPQCQYCNQTTMDRFVWDADGKVYKVNSGTWLKTHMTEACEEYMCNYYLHLFETKGLIKNNGD